MHVFVVLKNNNKLARQFILLKKIKSHVESEVLLDTLKGVRGGEMAVKMIFEGGLKKIINCCVYNRIKICNLLVFVRT